jgi:L-alanine-DL-glutamate epimerase-like enolase superfamily enzyme
MKTTAPHGYILIAESFADPERDSSRAELFEDPLKIADGMLTLKEQPGLGLTHSEAAVGKFGERIL